MRSLVLLLMITHLFLACTNQKNDSNKKRDVTIPLLNNISGPIKVDEPFCDFKLVSLGTNESSIFGRVDKLIKKDHRYFILDKTYKNNVFVFSENGKYLYTIGNIGKGVGEYSHIEDFTINEQNDILILSYPSKVIIYDSLGKFIREKQLSSSAIFWNICENRDGYFLTTNYESVTSGEEAYLIFYYDNNFSLQRKIINALPFPVTVPPFLKNPFLKVGNNISYFNFYKYEVYLNINNDQFNTIHFDMGGNEIPIELFQNAQDIFLNQKKYSFFISAILTNNILITTFASKGVQYFSVINTTNYQYKTFQINSWFPEFICYSDSIVYSTISPQMALKNNEDFIAKNTTVYQIKENSNPILLTFRYRDSMLSD